MNIIKKIDKSRISAAIALVIGVGVAIGGSIESYIVGIAVMLPLGIAMVKGSYRNKIN